MQHAGVVAGLMVCDLTLLFENDGFDGGKALRKAVRGGQPHNSAADDADIGRLHRS